MASAGPVTDRQVFSPKPREPEKTKLYIEVTAYLLSLHRFVKGRLEREHSSRADHVSEWDFVELSRDERSWATYQTVISSRFERHAQTDQDAPVKSLRTLQAITCCLLREAKAALRAASGGALEGYAMYCEVEAAVSVFGDYFDKRQALSYRRWRSG